MNSTTQNALLSRARLSHVLLAFALLCLPALAALTLTGPIGALALFVVVLLPLAALPTVLSVLLQVVGAGHGAGRDRPGSLSVR